MLQGVMVSHNLSYSAIVDVIKIINIVIGSKALPESEFIFKKVCNKNTTYNKKYFCTKCLELFDDNLSDKMQKQCKKCDSVESDFFISIPIQKTLEKVVTANIESIIEWQEQVESVDECCVSDICNGIWYKNTKSIIEGRFFSLNINTDGVAVFNSSNRKSLWPILITINKLPQRMRFQKKNVLSAGYWLSKENIDFDLFFKFFIDEMNDLFTNGININGINYKVIICCCCLDSVARAKFLNIKQFNGDYGCTICLQKTHKQRYLYKDTINIRTYDHFKECNQILNNLPPEKKKLGVSIKGVKGNTIMSKCIFFDPMKQCPPDSMHAIFLGITKLFVKIWFDPSNHDKQFYIQPNQRLLINKKLASLQTYSECGRHPRPITEFKTWKANEYFNWLFLYSKYCLNDSVLNPAHYRHFLKFIEIMESLHSDCITYTELDNAEKNVKDFVKNFQRLYGNDYMVYNVHLLLHIVDAVRKFGPLQNFSLFVYENYNGVLGNFLKGPNGPLIQLVKRYFSQLSLSYYIENISPIPLAYCKKVLKKQSLTYKITNESKKYEEIKINGKLFKSYKKYYVDFKTITIFEQSTNKKHNDSYIYFKNVFLRIQKILIDSENILYILGCSISTVSFINIPNYYQILAIQEPVMYQIDEQFKKCFHFNFKNSSTESLSIIKNTLTID